MKLSAVKAKTNAHKKYCSKYFSISVMGLGVISMYATLTISDDGLDLNIGEGDHSLCAGSWQIRKITDIYTMPHETLGTVTHIVIEA